MDPRQDPTTGRWMSPTEIEQKEEILVLQNLLRNSRNELKISQNLLRNTQKELCDQDKQLIEISNELKAYKKYLFERGIEISYENGNNPHGAGVIVSVWDKLRELEDRIYSLESSSE